jgi:hypothetical protein
MGLKTKDGIDMKDLWEDGVRTYLGMFVHGLPNAFLLYSPQGTYTYSDPWASVIHGKKNDN